MNSATVSAKIPNELRQRLREHGVEISEVIRRALEREALALEEAELKRRLGKIAPALRKKITRRDVVRAVRESREGR